MHGCTILPPVGCRAHLGASLATAVAAALRKSGSMTEILPSYIIQQGMDPHTATGRAAPLCCSSLSVCA